MLQIIVISSTHFVDNHIYSMVLIVEEINYWGMYHWKNVSIMIVLVSTKKVKSLTVLYLLHYSNEHFIILYLKWKKWWNLKPPQCSVVEFSLMCLESEKYIYLKSVVVYSIVCMDNLYTYILGTLNHILKIFVYLMDFFIF